MVFCFSSAGDIFDYSLILLMTTEKHRIDLSLLINEWKIFTVGRMYSSIPIYGKRVIIVTDASARGKYA